MGHFYLLLFVKCQTQVFVLPDFEQTRGQQAQSGLQPVNVFVQTLEEGFSRVGMSRSVGWVFWTFGDGCFFSVCRNLDFVSLLLPVPVTQYVLSERLKTGWWSVTWPTYWSSLGYQSFRSSSFPCESWQIFGLQNMGILSLQQSEAGRIMASLPGKTPPPQRSPLEINPYWTHGWVWGGSFD